MKTHKNLAPEENSTLDILDEIQEVKINPFFKDRVLHNMMNQETEETSQSVNWFTTPMQFAAIALILLINTIAIIQYKNSDTIVEQSSDIESFAKEYSLTSDDSISLN